MRKAAKRNAKPAGEYADEIVCLIVAIFIPPLGVFLFEGLSTNFWIDLLLTILLPWIGGLIFALYIILR
ncbi:MAG TPA: YqaE/Pmp3 family membrane protein [Bacteroidetes bacterium]|nr:YqaE/Pmp3 family membrane protein [Bacteroidota bacterium]